jgi:large subunit ribosomal protein L21
MLAVIRTGGKQYLVSPGQKIKIEKLNAKEKKEVIFKDVLLLEKNKKVEIGNSLIKGAKVIGKIISQGKEKKKIVFKWKAKSHYRVKRGHRQPFTEVEILKIED